MGSESNPAEVLFAESQRLEAFAGFWRRRIEIEKEYLDNLSGLRIPELSGDGQLQKLATKTHELLNDELEERRRGFAILDAAYQALRDILGTEGGPNIFDIWGRGITPSFLRINALAAETAAAERLTVIAREKEDPPMPSSATSEDRPRSGFLSRLIDRARNEQPHDNSSFLSADSAYRQKVQEINDEKYIFQNEIVSQNGSYKKHQWKCIVALKQVVTAFSAVQSDLAQVLNVTSSQLSIASSSMDASIESASFGEGLAASVALLIPRYRYRSHGTTPSLRPTTMLFGCPLPDEFGDASIGQRAVSKAFEAILSSATTKDPQSFFDAMRDANKQQSDDIKLSALQLETLWDPSQENGGHETVDFLATAPSCSLLVYFLTRLPMPIWPLRDSDVGRIIGLPLSPYPPVLRAFAKAGNRMSTERRCNLARFLLTVQNFARGNSVYYAPEGIPIFTGVTRILTGITDVNTTFHLASHLCTYIRDFRVDTSQIDGNPLILPYDSIKELRLAGLYND